MPNYNQHGSQGKQREQRGQGNQGGQPDLMADQIKKVAKLWELKLGEIDDIAQKAAQSWRGIKTNQIRNIYGYISISRNAYKTLNLKEGGHTAEEVRDMLIFLKPRLAYAAGRDNKIKDAKIEQFFRSAVNGLEQCDKEKLKGALDKFFKLSEAIVAYHRYYMG